MIGAIEVTTMDGEMMKNEDMILTDTKNKNSNYP